ncbi:MAG: carbamoyltransferase HypF [Candidatus Dormibacteria bacterium]
MSPHIPPSRATSSAPPRRAGDPGGLVVAAFPEVRVRRTYTIHGLVQGVGFRPFVWSLAARHGLTGSVRNTSGAVIVEAEGTPGALETFARALVREAPPLSRIAGIEMVETDPAGTIDFRIEESRAVAGEHQTIAADAATCPDCLAELFDPEDRRHLYPFINCTNCGPRFTIIEDIPYDRPLTTMRRFAMCSRCQGEYESPADRRFHAQPNACAECGPRLWFAARDGAEMPGDAVDRAVEAVGAGRIVALKGLGGFQLCCDAGDEAAVRRLRARKHRPAKPLALMCADLEAVRQICVVSNEEAELLRQPARPIVLLRPHSDAGDHGVAPSIAPGFGDLGVMLPSTPLHHLLLERLRRPLVMTSGNLTDEPIAKDNEEAVERLGGIADAFLLHDRDIYARYDDSVVRLIGGTPRMVRRARGFCPLPVDLRGGAGGSRPEVLALGAHLKNTFTLLKDGDAFVGPHIGDLDEALALRHQAEALTTYLRLFRVSPDVVACDLHPDYASSRLAETWWEGGARPVRVQHHHAHVASVMAEHGLRGRVLGIAFDGIGLGPDGTIWGGEILLCDERSYVRAGHLAPVTQPGGDMCAREGWRMAAAYLVAAGGTPDAPPVAVVASPDAPDARRWRLVTRLAAGDRAPVTTSAGRLFDAVASLLGVAQVSTFEGEAAMRLEALAAGAGEPDQVQPLPVGMRGDPLVIDTVSLVVALARERERGRPAAELALLFHESLAQAVAEAVTRLGAECGVDRVAMSGGVFQNALLAGRLEALLRQRGLSVHANSAVPANDGGISLGQALVAVSQRPEGGGAVEAECRDSVCVTCRDELVRLVVTSTDAATGMARGTVDGRACQVSIELVPDVVSGDVLLCQGGVALQRDGVE